MIEAYEAYVKDLDLIEPSQFVQSSVPKIHPKSPEYIEYWREEKRRCIEGYWVSGRWMPGKLYFYSNYATIRLNKKGSKVKSYGRPLLRDLEWMLFLLWEEARGFSGFLLDDDYTCNRAVLDEERSDEEIINFDCIDKDGNLIQEIYDNIFTTNENGDRVRKRYISARTYVRTIHNSNLGRPLYYNQAKNLMMLGSRGFGKDLHHNTKLWYEDGEKPIRKVRVGDQIFNHKGDLVTVTNVFKFTDQLQYEITLSDDRKIKCGAGHKWSVYSKDSKNQWINEVKELKDIIKNYKIGKRQDSRYFLKVINPLQYSHKKLPIDPYTLGALIGDGGLTQRVTFTTADSEIINNLVLPNRCQIKKIKGKYQYSITKTSGKTNPLIERLKLLGLMYKKSTDKFIPDIYMKGSFEQRLHLLQGLLDTDGTINNYGNITFDQSNKKLAIQVKTLCETLGIRCKLTSRKTKKLDSYRVHIITSDPVFRLKRKLSKINDKPSEYAKTNRTKVAIVDIQPTVVEDSYCISVDGPDNLFIAGDCIPTHNSYSVGAGIIAHEFLMDGSSHYTQESIMNPTTAEIIVGAYDAKYTHDLLDKVKTSITHLPGEYEMTDAWGNVKEVPSPLSKLFSGSWGPSSQITAVYQKKVGGRWKKVGSKTNIKNRTFRDNPFAANGTRPGIIAFEEIGMFNNLMDCYNSSIETQRNGGYKFGTMMFLGTGGDFDGGGTRDAYDMFYNPEKFDILPLNDIWENKGKIGYFVPAYLGLNEFKNYKGLTDETKAKSFLQKEREKLKSHKGDSRALNMELQYRPLVPSEIFLAGTGNIFPIAEIQERIAVLEQNKDYGLLEKRVTLLFDKEARYGVNYKIDTSNDLVAINKYPWDDPNREGCPVIYEFPQTDAEGKIPQDLYIIGHDPYAIDDPTGPSLGATYVIKTKAHWKDYGHDEVVAVYLGRPYAGRDAYNENLMKLSMLYGNAKIYFENVRGNVKEYFEKMGRLDLLAKRPRTIFNKRASFNTNPSQEYGYPMSNKAIKMDGVFYIRDWLVEERMNNDDKIVRNLDRIWDIALLKELVSFDLDGNYDRVMAFMGAIIGINERHNKFELLMKEGSKTADKSIDYSIFDTLGNRELTSAHRKHRINSLKIDWEDLIR